MKVDPYSNSLKTHQVNIPSEGIANSSRVTGDLRILWRFDKFDNMIIIAVKLGSHDEIYD